MCFLPTEIVRAEPFDASTPLTNADVVKDRIVLVARGAVPFAFKAHHAQAAGAAGVVIADVDGACRGQFDQRCVPGSSKTAGQGFGARESHPFWQQNRIPCVLLHQQDAYKLLELLSASS